MSRHYSHKTFSSFHLKGENIEDDWEYIEALDQELMSILEEEVPVDRDGSKANELRSSIKGRKVEKKCKILNRADIIQRLKDKSMKVATVLLLSRSDAAILLHHFKWSVSRSKDEWLSCETKVRKAVGLFDTRVVEISDAVERACGICHEKFPGDKMLGVSCGHQFCISCWTGYIRDAISDGPECLALRCPDPSCDAAVGLDVIEPLLSEEDKKKFEDYLVKAYLNGCKKAKWCPAPGCDYAVFLSAGSDDSTVTCQCSYKFCWNCTKECHAPVDCVTVVKWMSEISTQPENWKFANTRPCPFCQSPIQPNKEFDYIKCDICENDFCCECGHELSEHGSWMWEGDDCHLCESARPAGFRDNDELEREIAKSSFERFNRFHGGWTLKESSQASALKELKVFQNNYFEKMCANLGHTESELKFCVEALLQIVECHRLLKWMHVYAYFLTEDEHAKRDLFEFMEGEVNRFLRLFQNDAKELRYFLYEDAPSEKLLDFRKRLVTLTSVSRNYFNKLVKALEAGLPEVVSTKAKAEDVPGGEQLRAGDDDSGANI